MRDRWSPPITLLSRSITRMPCALLIAATLAGCATTPTTSTTSNDPAAGPSSDPSLTAALDDVNGRKSAWERERDLRGRSEVPEGDGGLADDDDDVAHRAAPPRPAQPQFNDVEPLIRTPRAASGADTNAAPAAAATTAQRGSFLDDPFGRGARPGGTTPTPTATDAAPNRALATPERTIEPVTPPAAPPAGSTPLRGTNELGIVLVDLQRELLRSSAFSDQPMREILAMALLAVIDPEIELTPDHLRDLTAEEQEKVLVFNRLFSGLGQKLDANTNSIDALLETIETLRTELVDLPELRIPDAALCWRVERFGTYDRFEPYRFLANEGQEVILYLELLGFTSVLGGEGRWVTELSQQIRIYDDRSGVLVWEDPWRSVTDTSTRERTDFFTTQQIFLPRRLSIGRYNLKIHVRDEQSGAEAERTLTFDIVAQRDLAASP